MNIGMICRFDNSGLGTLSWEFARNLKPKKVLLVENQVHQTFPERYKDFESQKVVIQMTPQQIDWFLDGVDMIMSFETFYYWPLIKEARKRGVKTVLMPMYEMTPDTGFPLMPDLILCPSRLDYDVFMDYSTRVEFLRVPVATDRLLWGERTMARTFVHSASHGGMSGRKGTQLFLDAIPLVKSKDIKFVIYTWQNIFRVNDPRVEIRRVNFKNYWQLWREGDVLVYPQDYNGICLPIVEAMSSGMGVITTDLYPFNLYMPKEMLFKPEAMYMTRAASNLMETKAAKITPQAIADKINQFANKKIAHLSDYGKMWAKKNSWDALLPEYMKLFKSLINVTKV
jgi:glycosyltransferase involved in cell wall biosynthesis